jgi:transcriptional regulator with XRE-family HTH domain
MAQKTIQGNEHLAKQIKNRRNELGLTIEEAAVRAGVGTKTWCRYEAGASIRADKCKGICKALNWHVLPDQETDCLDRLTIQEHKKHEAWSVFLEENFGDIAAFSFAAGSDILLDHIKEDLQELSSMPAGSHIGQIGCSCLDGRLPTQFLMQYDYEFLYQMKYTLSVMRARAKAGLPMTAHSVLEELILYLCNEEASVLIELSGGIHGIEDCDLCDSEGWLYDLFDDMDIITFLYSDAHLDSNHPYHYSHWSDQQFYTK